jgi:hypothetical protein
MQSRLESKEEQVVVDYMKDLYGVESLKLSLQGNRGWPDREFLLPLRPAWLEMKRKGEKPRKLQYYRMAHLKKLGYDVLWTDDKNEAIIWLEELYTARLSEAGDTIDVEASLRGSAIRPRIGKNIDIVSREFHSAAETANLRRPSNRAIKGGL